jgi:hypothetical protein
MRFPDDDLTIVVFRNVASRPAAVTIAGRLARRLLGLRPFAPAAGAPPAEVLRAVAGDWIGDEGPFRLAARDGRLRVELPGGPTMEAPWMGGVSFAAGEDEVGRFEPGGGGEGRIVFYESGLFESVAVRKGR